MPPGKDSNEPIRVVKFTPDSHFLAVGSEDSNIYIYNVRDAFSKKVCVCVICDSCIYIYKHVCICMCMCVCVRN